MNVCLLTETYAPEVGGGETQARLLSEGLLAAGHSVMILTRRSRAETHRFECVGQLPIYRLPPAGPGQLKKWGLLLSSSLWLLRLRRQYDVIFVSGYRIVGLGAVLLSALLGKRCVLKADSQGEMSGSFFHPGLRKLGLSPRQWPFRLFLWLRNAGLRRADAFAAITPAIAAELQSAGVPPAKIRLVPNLVDTARFCPVDARRKADLRQKLNLPHAAQVVIYTGRLVSYKGLPLLLSAWRRLHPQPGSAILLLVGAGGLDIHNCETELRDEVRAHGLEAVVRFCGSVANVHEYLQAADVFVLPTENDALPSALIEAMACGLPVITTRVGALATIVSHEHNGLIIEPRAEAQLLDALGALLGEAALRSRLGQEARRTVQERFSVTRQLPAYLALLGPAAQPSTSVPAPSAPSGEPLP